MAWLFAFAGAGGGLVASVATCPLDVIKTKLQAQTIARGHVGYLGVFGVFQHQPMFPVVLDGCSDTLKKIIRYDGFRGLYRGLGPTILGYLPTWAIYFSVYDGIKTRFGEAPLGSTQPRRSIYPAAHPKGYQPSIRDHPWSLHILSAMAAGTCSTVCTNPLWVIKTRFMVCTLPTWPDSPLRSRVDPTSIRRQVPAYSRRLQYHLPIRRASRLLSGTSPQSPWHCTRRRPIPSIRAAPHLGPSVFQSLYVSPGPDNISRIRLSCSDHYQYDPSVLRHIQDDSVDRDISTRGRPHPPSDPATFTSGQWRGRRRPFERDEGLQGSRPCRTADRTRRRVEGPLQGTFHQPSSDGAEQRCDHVDVRDVDHY